MDRMGVPFVLIGRSKATYPSVRVDNIGGGRELGRLFAGRNFSSIFYLAGPRDHVDSIDREMGFKMGLMEGGFDMSRLRILTAGDGRRPGCSKGRSLRPYSR